MSNQWAWKSVTSTSFLQRLPTVLQFRCREIRSVERVYSPLTVISRQRECDKCALYHPCFQQGRISTGLYKSLQSAHLRLGIQWGKLAIMPGSQIAAHNL